MKSVARRFVGIDLHLGVTQVCVLDEQGKVLREQRLPTGDPETNHRLLSYLARWRTGGRYAVEAIGFNRWLVNACLAAGLDVIVADPAKMNLKMLGKKTDRNDAYEIARRLYLGDIERNARTYYPTDAEYGVRKLVRTRHKLVAIRQQLINQIRALLSAYMVCLPGRLYSAVNLARLREIELADMAMTHALRSLGSVLADTQASIHALETRIQALVVTDSKIAAWAALPSIGPVTAVTLACELGDLRRFSRSRQVASYAGLVPQLNDSGERIRHERLSTRGNRELRWILGQWAVRLMARHPQVQAWAAVRLRQRRAHKNKVRTALARRLIVGLFAAQRKGEAFSLEKCLAA